MDDNNGWIELKDGCEMPDYDIPVLWYYPDGNMLVSDLDKDGNPHIFGHDRDELPDDMSESDKDFWCASKATHWMPLPQPPKTSDK